MQNTILLLAICMAITGCSTTTQTARAPANNPFTQGNVTLTIQKGKTTQEDVLKTFGAPNIVTKDSEGLEVWTYQKFATVSQGFQKEGYATVVILGGSSSSTRFEQTQRTMTLIIKFSGDNVVREFSSRTSEF